MSILTRSEQLALLVNLLGDDAMSMVRDGLNGERLSEVEVALRDFEQVPPTADEIDFVLDDFQRYAALAMQTAAAEEEADAEEDDDSDATILQIAEDHFEVEIEPAKKFESPTLTGNTNFDLNRMHPYQVAHTLRKESPSIVSIVVGKLANEHAAKTLELLPDALRSVVFLKLAQPVKTKPLIVESMLKTVLENALKVEERQESLESSEKMSSLLRSLPKAVRVPMMAELAEKDAELADEVKKGLYKFDDLLRLEDRDMQKLLGQCRSDSLVVALQQVEIELVEKVLGNMSKRAKEALQEEMEFKTNASQDEINVGREEVLRALIELDESGAITIG